MVRPPRNDRTLRLSQLSRELAESEWDDEPTTITGVPSSAPAPVRHALPFVLSIPPRHRAPLVIGVLLLATALLVYLVSAGHAPSWLE